MWPATPQVICSRRVNQGMGKSSRTARCRRVEPVGMTPPTDNRNIHGKAFQTLPSDSGPFLVGGAGFLLDPFIPPTSQPSRPQHYLFLLLLFIRCFYCKTDDYVHVISCISANIIAFFMQGLLCLLHSRNHKSHLTAFSSGKPFMMNEQSCCLQRKARIIQHFSTFSKALDVFMCCNCSI